MKKTFRGLLADEGLEQIRLSTNKGKIGYRVIKFQGMPEDPGANTGEHTLQLFTTENDETSVPRTPTSVVNFSDPTLIGAVALSTHSANMLYNEVIIFDSMVFNQDIFITHTDRVASAKCNYYLELEQINLSDNEATVATLKDMRAGPDTNFGP